MSAYRTNGPLVLSVISYFYPTAKKPAAPSPVPEPKLTNEELAILREQERQEKLAEKLKEAEEKRKKWEEEKERRRIEKLAVSGVFLAHLSRSEVSL